MRFVLLLSLGLLVGCASAPPESIQKPTVIDREMHIYGFDFSQYTDEGFLISPESYSGAYQSIGVIRLTLWSRLTRPTRRTDQGVTQYGPWNAEPVTPAAAIDSLYRYAKRMGADAIINFRTERLTEAVDGRGDDRHGVRVRGFAIDREEN